MPIYEYECQACNHYLDVLQKLSDDPLTFCPECGKAELRKLVSAPSFRLKGGGWYETDFKKDNQRNLADGGSGTKTAGKGEKAADASKPSAGGGDAKAAGKSTSSTAAGTSGGSASGSGGGDSA